MKNKFIISIALVFLPISSQADIISTSIPSFKGKYEYINDSRTVSFDMGVRFSSITSASIKLTARGEHGLAHVCQTYSAYVYSCMDYIDYSKAFYRIGPEGSVESGDLLVVDSTSDWNTTSIDLYNTEHLLDGKGTLTIEHGKTDFYGYITVFSYFYASDISLVIDGVVDSDATTSSNDCIEIPGTGTVSSNLDIHIPVLLYRSLEKNDNIQLDLEYLGTNSEENHTWGLKSLEVNDSNTCSETVGAGTVLSNNDLFLPSLSLETPNGIENIWGKLKYLEKNSEGQEIWELKGGYDFNPPPSSSETPEPEQPETTSETPPTETGGAAGDNDDSSGGGALSIAWIALAPLRRRWLKRHSGQALHPTSLLSIPLRYLFSKNLHL